MRAIAVYTILILFIFGCRKDEFDPGYIPEGLEYAGLRTGMNRVYQVNEIVYDDFNNKVDTLNYQLKEYNESEFTDLLGRKAVRVEIYKRKNKDSIWKFQYTSYFSSDHSSAERVEDNKRYIKLSFPINNSAFWNSNALNMETVNTVYYGLIFQKYKLDTLNFNSVVSIEGINLNTSSKERKFQEIYAKNTGLISKIMINLDKNSDGTIIRGQRLQYRLISYEP